MGLALPSEAKVEAEKRITEFETWIRSQKDLINHSHAFRSLYVVVLATRGAIMFDDLDELSDLCAAFCDEMRKRDAENN